MKKYCLALLAIAAALAITPAALADSTTYLPVSGDTNVSYSVNSGGTDYIGSPTPLSGVGGVVSDMNPHGGSWTLATPVGSGYSDTGIVVDFNGGLTLGQLGSVSVAERAGGTPLSINLWFDTTDWTISSGVFEGVNSGSYAACGLVSLTLSSSCYMMDGPDAGNTYTLAQLESGAISGYGADTQTALWIGFVGSSTAVENAQITSVDVTTTPEPSSLLLLGTGLLGLAFVAFRKAKASGLTLDN
jgi:hypothetical protein